MIGRGDRAARAEGDEPERAIPTYYHYPALKEPSWSWEIILYFFLGGLSAGSYLVATLADLFGRPEDRPVSRAGRYVAFASVLACPVLLIADLGRPERFPKMLRILKSRSPMSMGSWALTGYGVFAGLGVARQLVEDGLLSRKSLPTRVLAWLPLPASGVLGSLFAFFVASYTGVLLSFTNVPVWARNNLLQGPLFLTSALSSGVAAISLVLGLQGSHESARQTWLGRLETAASLGELGLIAAMLASLGPSARPVLRSRHGLSLLLGTVGLGILTPLALRRRPARSSEERRRRELGADTASLVGALVFRAAALLVGRASARDSREYFAFARDRE